MSEVKTLPGSNEFTTALLRALLEIERREARGPIAGDTPVTYNGEPIHGWVMCLRTGKAGMVVSRNFSKQDIAHSVAALIRSLKATTAGAERALLQLYMLKELAPEDDEPDQKEAP